MSTIHLIKLIELVDGETYPLGARLGKHVFEKLLTDNTLGRFIEISFQGIVLTDAVFARESIISLVKFYRGEKCFFLSNITSQDLIDNWKYAAEHKEQPIVIEHSQGVYQVIGTQLSSGIRQVFEYAIRVGTLTTSKVAEQFDLSAQNASQKLKKLRQMGLILGTKETAASGGLEYVYHANRRF